MAEPVKDSSFPIILGRDIVVHRGTLNAEDTVIGVIGGTTLARIPVTSLMSGVSSSGGGGDRISSYQGEISIKGPNGEAILVYNSRSKELTVGKGIKITQVSDAAPHVLVNDATEMY